MITKEIWHTSSLVQYIANERENKLHSIPFEIKNNKLQTVLDSNDFLQVRQRMTQLITRYGKAAIFAIPFNGEWMVQEAEILTVRMFLRRYVEYIRLVNRQYYYAQDGSCHDLYSSFNVINSILHITQWYETPNDKGESIKTTVSSWRVDWTSQAVPVWIFSHNADWVPEVVKAGVIKLINQYDELEDQYAEEWKFVRTGGIVNKSFAKMSAAEYERRKKAGDRFVDDKSFNGKLQEGIGTTTSGSSSIPDIINLIGAIKDQVFHFVGIQRDEPQGTKQVGSLEIMARQNHSIDTIFKIKEFQQAQWNKFFTDMCSILGIRKEQPELQLSILERMKLEAAQASITQLKGSVAKPNNNDTENTDNEDNTDGGK